ncbi:MAG: RNA methyltransferase [Saprospirales bacterium]|nr:MAG: RNA methyltransferase [Saprospirales bacterium]
MLSRAKISAINSLTKKKFRDQNRLYVIEGMKLFSTAAHCSKHLIKEVFLLEELVGEVPLEGIETNIVDAKLMKKISQLKTPQGILALVSIPQDEKLRIDEGPGLYFFLDAVQDPGNVGTIIRTCDWYGVRGLFSGNGCADLYNPKVIQAAMGSHFNVNIHQMEFRNCVELLRPDDIFGATTGGKAKIGRSNEKVLVCLGNEGSGLSQEVLEGCTGMVGIEGREDRAAESLNVSMTAAIFADRYFCR